MGKGWRDKSTAVASTPARRNHAAGEASPKGCLPRSYVPMSRTTIRFYFCGAGAVINLRMAGTKSARMTPAKIP
jgi:hypothetical protein